jgi:hypothetical protein
MSRIRRRITTKARHMQPFMATASGDVSESVFSDSLMNRVLLFDASAVEVIQFDATDTGLAAALAAAADGDMVRLPVGTIAGGPWTVPESTVLSGWDRSKSTLTGRVNLSGPGSALENLTVAVTANSSADIVAVGGPGTTGENQRARIRGCDIRAAQAGTGAAYAIEGGAGELHLLQTAVDAESTGGLAAAVHTAAGVITHRYSAFHAAASGANCWPFWAGDGEAISMTIDSSTDDLCLDLGAKTNAPPAGWYELDFDDSEWANAVVAAGGTPPQIWPYEGFTGQQRAVFRRHVEVPTGTVTAAALTYFDQDDDGELYINETLLKAEGGANPTLPLDITTLFLAGEDNVIANNIADIYTGSSGVRYRVTVTGIGVLNVSLLGYASVFDEGFEEAAIPDTGDRAAFDALGYPDRHANDTDEGADALHHTLGTGAAQAAAGNHTHAAADAITAGTPASASATGTAGQIRYDGTFLYICTATDTWRRVGHEAW